MKHLAILSIVLYFVNSVYQPWGEWSTCSATCGKNRTKQRIRKCIQSCVADYGIDQVGCIDIPCPSNLIKYYII